MFSTAFVDGLVLTATVQGDRHGASASAGLAPGLARDAKARLDELAALSRPERHRVVRALVGSVAAVPPDAAPKPRIGAILAPNARVSVGEWAAPRVRRGFRASRGLRATLRRLAASSSESAAEEERAAAARVDTLAPSLADALRACAEEDGHERALGALVLGAEGREGGDARTRRLYRIGRELALVSKAPWR